MSCHEAQGGAPIVFVVEPDTKQRHLFEQVLEAAGFTVRTSASTEGFFRGDAELVTGCLITELRLPHPGVGGLALLERVGKDIPVIIATAHADLPTAVRAMRGGAFFLFEKPVPARALVSRVRQALDVFSERKSFSRRRADWVQRVASLAPREREVMTKVIDGAPTRVIAADLGITYKTAEHYRGDMMQKLGVKTVADLVRTALDFEERISEPPASHDIRLRSGSTGTVPSGRL